MGMLGPSPHAKFKSRQVCLQLVIPDPLNPSLFWYGPADRSLRASHTTRGLYVGQL